MALISTVRRPRSGDVASTIGALLFLAGAVLTGPGMLLPHAPRAEVGSYMVLAAAMFAFGIALLLVPRRWAKRTPPVAITAAVIACSVGLLFNGERNGGTPMLNELYYVWPALYAGYFFRPRATAVVLAGIAASYITVLNAIGLSFPVISTRAVVTLSVLGGTAFAMRTLRNHVDRLLERLHALARTDALTGLLNRRAFDERLQGELNRSHRTSRPFALVLADIDHFKSLNDQHGHAAGDRALMRVGEALVDASRGVDTVARIGGEEFALLLPDADLGAAREAADRLRRAVADIPQETLTISVGVAEGPLHGTSPSALLCAADRALYAAKAAGRDRTAAPDEATVRAPG